MKVIFPWKCNTKIFSKRILKKSLWTAAAKNNGSYEILRKFRETVLVVNQVVPESINAALNTPEIRKLMEDIETEFSLNEKQNDSKKKK